MRVAVLGAGLQGACTALELARAGVKVDLYERESACLTRASAQNEGKVHLGYVFAKDPTLATARAMARGALTFMPLLRFPYLKEGDTLAKRDGMRLWMREHGYRTAPVSIDTGTKLG